MECRVTLFFVFLFRMNLVAIIHSLLNCTWSKGKNYQRKYSFLHQSKCHISIVKAFGRFWIVAVPSIIDSIKTKIAYSTHKLDFCQFFFFFNLRIWLNGEIGFSICFIDPKMSKIMTRKIELWLWYSNGCDGTFLLVKTWKCSTIQCFSITFQFYGCYRRIGIDQQINCFKRQTQTFPHDTFAICIKQHVQMLKSSPNSLSDYK